MTLVSFAPETQERDLPTPEELQKEIPLNRHHSAFIAHSRESVEAILNGWDSRLLIIAGPCSIHDLLSARDYARRLRQLAEKVSDRLFLIMRTYVEKPRTIVGWKGLLYDPDLDGSYNLNKGIRQSRQLLAEITEIGIPCGCELLEINTAPYFADFLTWGCIGARTSSSPPHRQLAASMNFPIGFKNSIDGNLDQPIHGIIAASQPHVFLGHSQTGQMVRIQAEGNPLCHIVLRGSLAGPNYKLNSIQTTFQKCQEANLLKRVLIDCSHDNCGKDHTRQVKVFEEVLSHIEENRAMVAGLMLESHLFSGSQSLKSPLRYGVSVTDPCIDWETTERLILDAYSSLK